MNVVAGCPIFWICPAKWIDPSASFPFNVAKSGIPSPFKSIGSHAVSAESTPFSQAPGPPHPKKPAQFPAKYCKNCWFPPQQIGMSAQRQDANPRLHASLSGTGTFTTYCKEASILPSNADG
ncbi:Uncharacterized protein XB17_00521 [Leptospira santarosai]|nr:Uncharacterized protein XB17_00521 [Leptospira santarosai]